MSNTVAGVTLPRLDSDGKAVVYATPSTPGWNTWISSAGDAIGPPVVRGGGDLLVLSWDADEARGQKSKSVQFAEPVQLHDGGMVFDPAGWSIEDITSFGVKFDGTVTTANGSGTGNCNCVPIGGGANLIVPAAGDGAYNVDLTAAVPVPAPAGDGYWDADYDTGVITPSPAPGHALFNLVNFSVESAMVCNVIFFNKRGEFSLPAYGVEWVHPNWKLVATVNKQSSGAGTIAGYMRCFRRFGRV
jgi:hypothetical protein